MSLKMRDRLASTATMSAALSCATVSTALGGIYLFAAGAPSRYLLINAAALALGIALATLGRLVFLRNAAVVSANTANTPNAAKTAKTAETVDIAGTVTVAVGLLLLATAVFGFEAEGATRWIRLAGLTFQPSLILLPAAIVHFARRRDALSAIGLSIAGVALALQPDRAMAGVLVAGLAAVALTRPLRHRRPGRPEHREPFLALAIAAAAAGFAATLLRTDAVPPMPYVEQVLQSSFAVHPLIGLAVAAGLAIMLVPALAGLTSRDGVNVGGVSDGDANGVSASRDAAGRGAVSRGGVIGRDASGAVSGAASEHAAGRSATLRSTAADEDAHRAMNQGSNREACIVFGAVWLAVLASAILGNYPTPLVGYGSSAILGYCFSTTMLA